MHVSRRDPIRPLVNGSFRANEPGTAHKPTLAPMCNRCRSHDSFICSGNDYAKNAGNAPQLTVPNNHVDNLSGYALATF